MHFFDAHMAYSAPRRFMKKFVPRERSSKSVREQLTDRGWFSPYFKEYGKKVPLDHFPRSYKAAVSYIDHTLGLFFSMLKQFGLFDDALIFLTSDHGECLNGDHDIYCAHKKLFDETINVPFFVKFQGSEFGGRSSDLIVEHTDIAPTAVGYVTGRTPEYMGTDLRELLSGRAAPRKYAFSEHVDNYMRSVRDGDNIFVEIVEGMENKWGMKVEREKLFRRNGDPLADAGLESAMLSEMSSFMSKNASSSEGDDLGRDDKDRRTAPIAGLPVTIREEHKRVAKEGGYAWVFSLIGALVRYGNSVILTRMLGARNFGFYALANTIVTVTAIATSFGFPTSLVHFVAKDNETKRFGDLKWS